MKTKPKPMWFWMPVDGLDPNLKEIECGTIRDSKQDCLDEATASDCDQFILFRCAVSVNRTKYERKVVRVKV